MNEFGKKGLTGSLNAQEKNLKKGIFFCVLLIKPIMKTSRISFIKLSFFLYLLYDLWRTSWMLATSDKVTVVFAKESLSNNN